MEASVVVYQPLDLPKVRKIAIRPSKRCARSATHGARGALVSLKGIGRAEAGEGHRCPPAAVLRARRPGRTNSHKKE